MPTNATTNTCDNFDEFFDFALLEHDHGLQCGSSEDQDDPQVFAEDVLMMDWQPLSSAESFQLPTSAMTSYQQTPMQTAFDNHIPKDSGFVAPSDRFLFVGSGNADAQAINSEYTCSAPSVLAPVQSGELTRTLSPLSSSSLPTRALSGITGDVLANPTSIQQSPPLPQLEQRNDVTITRSSLPTRQASTASWKPASAKRKGLQNRIPLESKQILEDEFATNPYPCSWEMDIIAHQASLDVKRVRNWFNNTRARKKCEDLESTTREVQDGANHSLRSRLSQNSLEALDQQADQPARLPQPPLAVYLAQSYQEEAAEFSAVQAAIDNSSLSGSGSFEESAWSGTRRGSLVASVVSSEGTALTAYTISSNGSQSNVSSFGRERRRGRRRVAWKESPYTRPKFNGVNNAGEQQKNLPFFCTFCPRAFKTKYEWIRHEDSVHALRTTWICCETRNAPLDSCPFCGVIHPDDDHMASHKYQQCASKPESQRTFYRRDHFVQHLHHVHFGNAKHPAVRVGCQARLMASEGHNFGCKDIAMKWRKFGAPMKKDDPMLHCGFCGKISKDWSERCVHVAEHLITRELDRSGWWPERAENHLENLYSASPFESFRCRYCRKVFTDVKSMSEHSHCRVWSCRFLKSFDDVTAENAGPPLCPDFPSAKAHHCHLCGTGYRAVHVEHAKNHHRYRSCNQEFYTSEEAFLQHLHNFHGASQPLLLRGSSVVEQNFMRNKGASFEPVEFNESMQPCHMDLDSTPLGSFVVEKAGQAMSPTIRRDQSLAKKSAPARKKTREASQPSIPGAAKAPRQRSDTITTTRSEQHSPRFFRLSSFVPFFSSRIFYSRSANSAEIPRDSQAVLEEIPKPSVASLVMSTGLLTMAAARLVIRPEKQAAGGVVELTLDEGVDVN